ncbi:unnamed protein product, partial [Iphiclides podalirius]
MQYRRFSWALEALENICIDWSSAKRWPARAGDMMKRRKTMCFGTVKCGLWTQEGNEMLESLKRTAIGLVCHRGLVCCPDNYSLLRKFAHSKQTHGSGVDDIPKRTASVKYCSVLCNAPEGGECFEDQGRKSNL